MKSDAAAMRSSVFLGRLPFCVCLLCIIGRLGAFSFLKWNPRVSLRADSSSAWRRSCWRTRRRCCLRLLVWWVRTCVSFVWTFCRFSVRARGSCQNRRATLWTMRLNYSCTWVAVMRRCLCTRRVRGSARITWCWDALSTVQCTSSRNSSCGTTLACRTCAHWSRVCCHLLCSFLLARALWTSPHWLLRALCCRMCSDRTYRRKNCTRTPCSGSCSSQQPGTHCECAPTCSVTTAKTASARPLRQHISAKWASHSTSSHDAPLTIYRPSSAHFNRHVWMQQGTRRRRRSATSPRTNSDAKTPHCTSQEQTSTSCSYAGTNAAQARKSVRKSRRRTCSSSRRRATSEGFRPFWRYCVTVVVFWFCYIYYYYYYYYVVTVVLLILYLAAYMHIYSSHGATLHLPFSGFQLAHKELPLGLLCASRLLAVPGRILYIYANSDLVSSALNQLVFISACGIF